MQRRMTHTHTVVLSGVQTGQKASQSRGQVTVMDKKLICKFHRAGNCREGADSHTDPLTGITYTHDGGRRK